MAKYRITIYSPYGDFTSERSITDHNQFYNMIDDATADAADAVRALNPDIDYCDIIYTFSYTVERLK